MLLDMKAAQPPAEHPPLAHDTRGNLLPIPEGTAAWRISRHTGGRPRVIYGPDKQPARFPLETTPEELLDMCGADTYRVHALDEVGQVIDHVTNIDIGNQLRNAGGIEVLETVDAPFAAANAHSTTPTTSDMQRAFETMANALANIAKTNGDALRAVTEAQADWIKSIAQAKGGLLRNVGLPEWFVRDRLTDRRRERDVDDDEDDGHDEDERDVTDAPSAGASPSGLETFLGAIGPVLPELMTDWRGRKQAAVEVVSAPTDTRFVIRQLAKVRKLLSADERLLLDQVLDNDPMGDAIAMDLATKPADEVAAWIRAQAAGRRRVVETPPSVDPEAMRMIEALGAKATQALKLVDAPLQLRLMKLGIRLRSLKKLTPEMVAMIAQVQPLTVEDTASWLRDHIDEIERRFT
jgi:hypothetical protein